MIDVAQLARLAHLSLSQEERATLARDLEDIVDFISRLPGGDEAMEPQVSEPYNVLREDEIIPFDDPARLRDGFPEREGAYMKISKVIDHDR